MQTGSSVVIGFYHRDRNIKWRPIVKQGRSAVICAKTAETDRDAISLVGLDGPKESCISRGPDPSGEGKFFGKGALIIKYRDILPLAVQKRLNRSICCLGYGLGLVERSTGSIAFARWGQCAPCGRPQWRHLAHTIEPSVYGCDARPYVILL